MGCDFYIVKSLQICLNDERYLYVVLERERGYYSWDYDEDEEDYDEKVKAYKARQLTPTMKPIVVYENHGFRQSSLETKYKTLVEETIKDQGREWSDIVNVVKVEERYERE
jgi:hypothetical protein